MNARIVLPNEVLRGTLLVRDGVISALDSGSTGVTGAVDLEGDLLLPGLVDLHTDNLERHLQPRPGVAWPTIGAAVAHDRQMAAAGVTTVFDSLCVGDQVEGRTGREDALLKAIEGMDAAAAEGLLGCEHLLHLRCEVSSLGAAAAFAQHVEHPRVRLASLMDHTPGQRQWRRMDRWLAVKGSHIRGADDVRAIVEHRRALQQQLAGGTRCAVAVLAAAHGIVLASHDDTTEEHIDEAVADGVSISEFPTTEIAAAAARRNRLSVIMGAPNLVLGGSHAGNVSARDLVAVDLVNGLASDYVPGSLLHACFLSHTLYGKPLPDAIGLASSNPARMVGFTDRGEIGIGKRADLIWVNANQYTPLVRGTWCRGQAIA